MYLNERPSESLKELNALRSIIYIRTFLKSIKLEKLYNTKTNSMLKDLKIIVIEFLNSIKNRKGISGFEIIDIHTEIETISIEIYIDYENHGTYKTKMLIPYTTNYGLK